MENMINNEKYDGKIITQLFILLLPAQILSFAVSLLGGIINGVLIGNFLDQNAVLALGYVSPLVAIIGAIGSVISGGSRILAGRYIGRNELKNLDYIFSLSIIMAVVVGGLLTICGFCFSKSLAVLFGAKGISIEATSLYIRGLSFGFIPTLLNPSLMVYLQMSNKSNYSLASAVVLAGTNLLFSLANVTLINGGILGMGIAVCLSQYATVIFLLAKFVLDKSLMHWDISGIKKAMVSGMVALGAPTAIAAALYALRNVAINYLALTVGGEKTVSAIALVSSAVGPFDAVNIGYGAVVLIIASVFVGEKNAQGLKALLRTGLKIGLILSFAKVVIIAALGRPIMTIFGAEGEILDECYQLFVMLAINMPMNILTVSWANIYQSRGKVNFVNLMYVINAFASPVLFALVACKFMGVWGIWTCYLFSEVVSTVFILVAAPIMSKHKLTNFYDILCLDNAFDKGKSITISIDSMEAVIDISKNVEAFCKENGIDNKRSLMAGLCLEEMAGNVVEHGFIIGKKKDYRIDVFVEINGNDVNMILRNNTPLFNPLKSFSAFDPNDPAKNIGIRMVDKLAKEMNYQSSFGMNVLSISL